MAGVRWTPRRALALAWALAITGLLWVPSARAVAEADRPSPGPSRASLPDFEQVRAAHRPSDLVVLDRHGEPLQSVRVDEHQRRLAWVPLEAMSPALLEALVLGEDRRFWQHAGVDWTALAAGAWRSAWDSRTRGASTLTMQLAALLDEDLARPAGGRSLTQKADQALTALRLERRWSKSQILEAYLNRVGWRGELVGIGALSQTLFDKHPHGLNRLESALAAGLVRGPNAAAPRVVERACRLLAATPEAQPDDCREVEALAERSLSRRGQPVLQAQIAPHAARALLAQAQRSPTLLPWPSSLREQALARGVIDTTLDARVQRLAREAVAAQLAELAGRSVGDAAVIVLDNASGEVLAWVGSGGASASAPAVDAVLARRQAGSTLKPFVYLAAFESAQLTAASLLDDSPAQIPTGAGLWRPQNYDHRHRGWVTARTALASSLNLPAVRVAQGVGVEPLHRTLQAVGLELDQPAGHYGLSLALGSADVTLLALSNAYRTLALQGWHSAVRLHRLPGSGLTATGPSAASAGAPRRRVADAAASFVVSDILADPLARAPGFGLANALETRGWAAVKTGTSKDMRDNWCIGFTDRHTIGVWVGNAGGEPMHRVSGVTGAAPIWQTLVTALAAGHGTSRAPTPPPGAQKVAGPTGGNDPRSGVRAGLPHDRPDGVGPGAGPAPLPVGITNPTPGSVIALDPDIPATAQRLWLEGERGTWVLNGQRLGTASRLAWPPTPGRHRLALLGADGRERDAVVFEVRMPPLLRPAAARR